MKQINVTNRIEIESNNKHLKYHKCITHFSAPIVFSLTIIIFEVDLIL